MVKKAPYNKQLNTKRNAIMYQSVANYFTTSQPRVQARAFPRWTKAV